MVLTHQLQCITNRYAMGKRVCGLQFSTLENSVEVAIGKSETRRDVKTGILKFEPEMKKCSDLIEKHICDQQTQNLRLRDPLESSARFQDLG